MPCGAHSDARPLNVEAMLTSHHVLIGTVYYAYTRTNDDSANNIFRGVGVSMVNYGDELPLFVEEVLPRLKKMGVRAA